MTKPKSDYSIQTVSNALRVLEAFHEEQEIGVSDLSRRLDLHKNNIFRLLATLEESGYIEQSASSERYRLGARCLELGRAFARGNTLLQCSRQTLGELARTTGESAHMAVMQNYEVVHLDAEQPNALVVTASRVGQRLPLHCTALGKVLLGCADDGTRERFDREVVTPKGLTRETQATIVDRDKLFEHLSSVSIQGSAIDVEECAEGLCCAAAPVYGADGRLVAALSVSGPCFRLDEDALLREVVPVVMDAADQLSRRLGSVS